MLMLGYHNFTSILCYQQYCFGRQAKFKLWNFQKDNMLLNSSREANNAFFLTWFVLQEATAQRSCLKKKAVKRSRPKGKKSPVSKVTDYLHTTYKNPTMSLVFFTRIFQTGYQQSYKLPWKYIVGRISRNSAKN